MRHHQTTTKPWRVRLGVIAGVILLSACGQSRQAKDEALIKDLEAELASEAAEAEDSDAEAAEPEAPDGE